jgi:AmmeMemoRadiSam system protein B
MKKLCLFVSALLVFCAACRAAGPEAPGAAGPQAPSATATAAGYAPWRGGKVIDTTVFASKSDLALHGLSPAALPPNVRALIVPHHSIALRLAAQAIAGLAQRPPQTVLLLGPNHPAEGPKIAATCAAFATYHGVVRPWEEPLRALERQGLLGIADSLFEREHSIGAVVPLISQYWGKARVAPVIFHKTASFRSAKKIIQTALANPNAVVVASIDFSHGLSGRAEPARRAEMEGYLKTFQSQAVLGLDKTYLDAPVVLAALLAALRESGVNGVQVIAGANAAEFLGRDLPNATGYLTAAFYAPEQSPAGLP